MTLNISTFLPKVMHKILCKFASMETSKSLSWADTLYVVNNFLLLSAELISTLCLLGRSDLIKTLA